MPVDISLGIFRANKNESDKYQVPFYVEEYDPDKLICDLIRRSAYISPEGRVLTCGLCAGLRMQGDFPTLFEKNFSECISTPEYMKIADMRVQDFLKVNEKCKVKNGYPPKYSPEVFRKVMEQVENFKLNN